MSSPKKRARLQRNSRTIAATTNTTFSTQTYGISTPKCPSSRNGTITKSWRTGGPAKHSTAGVTTREAPCSSPLAGAAPFMSSCRCATARPKRGRIYRKISYGPLLDLFLLDMRSYRGPNAQPTTQYGPDAYLLGPVQLAWLKRELNRSSATWKIIASDTPLGPIACPAPDIRPPLGRGIEIADLLSFMNHAAIRNTIWITADLHYTAAHYFDPNRAVFQEFE